MKYNFPQPVLQAQTVSEIIDAVVDKFGVTFDKIREKNRTYKIAVARQALCYLIRKKTDLQLVEIAAIVEYEDHSSVIHCLKVMELRMNEFPDIKKEIKNILSK